MALNNTYFSFIEKFKAIAFDLYNINNLYLINFNIFIIYNL